MIFALLCNIKNVPIPPTLSFIGKNQIYKSDIDHRLDFNCFKPIEEWRIGTGERWQPLKDLRENEDFLCSGPPFMSKIYLFIGQNKTGYFWWIWWYNILISWIEWSCHGKSRWWMKFESILQLQGQLFNKIRSVLILTHNILFKLCRNWQVIKAQRAIFLNRNPICRIS